LNPLYFLLVIPVFFILSVLYLYIQSRVKPLPRDEVFVVWRSEPIQVVRGEEGELLLNFKDHPLPDSITTGTSPEEITHPLDFKALTGKNQIPLTNLDPAQRHYFELHFEDRESMVVAERILPLERSINLRDLGGYETSEGRRVKWGRVFRSGHLSFLTPTDLAYLEKMGLKLVCDLRAHEDIQRYPDKTPSTTDYLHHPVYEVEPIKLRHVTLLRHRLLEINQGVYKNWMVDRGALTHGELIKLISDPGNHPMLYHCNMGKDRVGVSTAVVLLALGVPEETVVDDYTVSNLNAPYVTKFIDDNLRRFRWMGVRVEQYYPLIAANPVLIRTALDHIRTQYGSAEDFLITAAGLEPHHLEQLRDVMLE
jgi:protein-tyrosine phosphatase